MRSDDFEGMIKFAGLYEGGVALAVLGGVSARNWKQLRNEIDPTVIIGANGTCLEIDNLDFHLVTENLHMANTRANLGDARYQQIMKMLTHLHHARHRLVSYLSWDLIKDTSNAVSVKRIGELGDDWNAQMARFSFREYGDGLLAGPLFIYPGAMTSPRIKFRVGTVATQLLHLAGILGVKQVYTIGMDFCFRKGAKHHWYEYVDYQPDRFRTHKMFTVYEGLATQQDWLQGARWLKSIEWLFERDGLQWIDHSNGLFKVLGLQCASL
jgi:hypothetical protein